MYHTGSFVSLNIPLLIFLFYNYWFRFFIAFFYIYNFRFLLFFNNRDSKLTYFLRDALGGNSKTVLILCCAPEKDHVPETVSTLRFGERAKRIKNKARINEEVGLEELKALLSRLKDENKMLKSEIERLGSATTITTFSKSDVEKESDVLEKVEISTCIDIPSSDAFVETSKIQVASTNKSEDADLTVINNKTTMDELTVVDSDDVIVGIAETENYRKDLESDLKLVVNIDIRDNGDNSEDKISIKGLRQHIALLSEEVGRLHGVVGMKDDELEEERTRSDQDKKKALELQIENDVLRGTVKDLEEKLIHQMSLSNRENNNSTDRAQATRSNNNSIEFLVSINSTLANLEVNNSNTAGIPDSEYVAKLKQEYNQQLIRCIEKLNYEQQARAQLSERLEDADQHISNLRGRLQSAEDNALLREEAGSTISWFSYMGRKIESAGRKATNQRGPYISPREELLSRSLAESQTRCIELESELGNMKEAHMIVLETKDSVLRNFIHQNRIITLDRDEHKYKVDLQSTRINQLTALLRDIEILKQSNNS